MALTQKEAERAKPQAKRYWLKDEKVTGLRLVVFPGGEKSWQVRYKVGRGEGALERTVTIARLGEMDLETARLRAGEVILAGRQGRDILAEQIPVGQLTLRQLWLDYVAEVGPHWSADTRRLYLGRWEGQEQRSKGLADIFLAKLGDRPARGLPRQLVVKLHLENEHRKVMANKMLHLLRQLYRWARDTRRLRVDADNPCDPTARIQMFELEESPGRELNDDELARIGAALEALPLLFRVFFLLLATTGARPRELYTARKDQVDFFLKVVKVGQKHNRKARKTKTNKSRALPILEPVMPLLSRLLEESDPKSPWLFAVADSPEGHLTSSSYRWWWTKIKEETGVEARPYDLRHTVITRGVQYSLFGTQALVGHTQVRTTQGYVHPSVAVMHEVAAQAGGSVAKAMLREEVEN